MPKTALIWDLDGTLFDSYPIIVRSMCDTYAAFGLDAERAFVHEYVLRRSVRELCGELAAQHGLDADAIYARYQQFSESRGVQIPAMPHARETLAALAARGCLNFVYTHRGPSALEVLERTGLAPSLTEVLTAESGFPRKPDPTAILFLMEKYGLDKENTWYVGDRSLDMEAAERAGIHSILLLSPDSPVVPSGREDLIVSDLSQIPDRL